MKRVLEFRDGPSRPGIFGVDLEVERAGVYDMSLRVEAPGLQDVHELGPVTVYAPGAPLPADPATVYGWAVTRITPEGVVDRRIEVPVQKPSMPAFGGAELSTLFVTSIGSGGTVPSEAGRDGVAPGALLAIDLAAEGIQGVPEPLFAGTPPRF